MFDSRMTLILLAVLILTAPFVGWIWSVQFAFAAAEYGLRAAIGLFVLKIAGAAAAAWLVWDLFLKDPPKAASKTPANDDAEQ